METGLQPAQLKSPALAAVVPCLETRPAAPPDPAEQQRTALSVAPPWRMRTTPAPMATNFLTKIFGSRNDRLLKQYRRTVEQINALEAGLEKLSDEQLRAKTQEFRERLAKGEESVDD